VTRSVIVAAAALALSLAAAASATAPTDPLAAAQWYLDANRTFDAWTDPPPLAVVRVAVIDSGIDRGSPEFLGRIAAARSFVGGTADDEQGHGTIVAGIIAANTSDGIGIAGSSASARLLIAKVVDEDGTVSVDAEARAIHWAVDRGARVVNVSLGGLRDGVDASRDTFSPLEAAAVRYAVSKGVLVVAAVGNGDQAPVEPWRYASYPAALPHVLGVGAVTKNGAVPAFSNRDPVYVDISAPGQNIVSTFPRTLTARSAGCVEQGTTMCAGGEYRNAEGTSFAAPQVAAAAATLFALRPSLRAEQVRQILERSARDAKPATGCSRCEPGRDLLSGWGRLDVAAAVSALGGPLPHVDRDEPNDGAGEEARKLWGSERRLTATVDYWNDPADVYAVLLRKGERLVATLSRQGEGRTELALWRPGTVTADLAVPDRALATSSIAPVARIVWRATETGWYPLEVRRTTEGAAAYTLVSRRSLPPR
jgi:serine protease